MSSNAPDPTRAESGTQEISELLEQVQVLAAKVERLQDGAAKKVYEPRYPSCRRSPMR